MCLEVYLNTYALVQMAVLTGPRVASNQQLNGSHSIRQKPLQSNELNQITRTKRECEHWHRNDWSWGNWQDQQQASVLHMACHFHSFHKENTKSVISHYLRLINNHPDMLNLFSAVTKTWGKRSLLRTFQFTSEPRARRDAKPRSPSRAKTVNEAVLPLILWGVSQETGLPGWLSALIKPDGFLTLNKWIDLDVTSLTRFVSFYAWHKGGRHENKRVAIC